MGPQPLSRINPHATTKFDSDTLIETPDLAVYPMAVIGRWAQIDTQLALLLSSLLHTPDLSVAMAMLQALIGGDAKRAALSAAAAEGLGQSSDDYRLFECVLKVIKPSRDRRHDFAHHLWGKSPDVPDALLLVDPRSWVKHMTKYEVRQKARRDPSRYYELLQEQPDILDRNKIQVFRRADLKRDAAEAETAHTHVLLLRIGLDTELSGGAHIAEHIRQHLLSVPAIRQAFAGRSHEKTRAARFQLRRAVRTEKR